MEGKRYFFDQDNSSHWYLVDADKRKDWDAWNELDEDDEEGWEEPDYATRINGGASNYTFADPIELP